ncbi:unnamed protein product [Periconia digitata]|uniref:Uncharacterized protein n=1 Tax=Periconia digitata TaxID=1303443 RepID=A0A9W4XLW3_9PLEO|nr:unnamed protein product [Periconia digitata]
MRAGLSKARTRPSNALVFRSSLLDSGFLHAIWGLYVTSRNQPQDIRHRHYVQVISIRGCALNARDSSCSLCVQLLKGSRSSFLPSFNINTCFTSIPSFINDWISKRPYFVDISLAPWSWVPQVDNTPVNASSSIRSRIEKMRCRSIQREAEFSLPSDESLCTLATSALGQADRGCGDDR